MAIMSLSSSVYNAVNDFTLDITTNRTSGVGPLAVSFDLIESSTFGNENIPMLTEFVWDFGDEGDSYNVGKGYCVNHVYREVGTYTATVTAYYKNIVKIASVEITVSTFSGTTYYISADGSDSNDGLSELNAFATPAHAFTFLTTTGNMRFLFRQGDTFSQAGAYNLGSSGTPWSGPVIIGSYEDSLNPSSEKPIFYNTTNNDSSVTIFYLSNTIDYRFVNITLQSGGTTTTAGSAYQYPGGIGGDSTYWQQNTLVLDCYFNNIGRTGLQFNGYYCVAQDCEFDSIGSYGIYAKENYGCAYIGIYMHNMGLGADSPEYTIRLQGSNLQLGDNTFIQRTYLAYNDLRADYTKSNFQLRGDDCSYNYLYKNRFDRATGINPQNDSYGEVLHHNTVDSNIFLGRTEYNSILGNPVNVLAMDIQTRQSMFRNNIIWGFNYGLSTGENGIIGSPYDVWIFNNTIIATKLNSYFSDIYALTKHIKYRNNIFYNTYDVSASYADRFFYASSQDTRKLELTEVNSDYNIFLGVAWGLEGSQNFISVFNDSSSPYTLSEWRSASGNDINSIFGDPLLNTTIDTNDVDGSLSNGFASVSVGSPAIDAGERRATVCHFDFFDNLRSDRTMGAIGG